MNLSLKYRKVHSFYINSCGILSLKYGGVCMINRSAISLSCYEMFVIKNMYFGLLQDTNIYIAKFVTYLIDKPLYCSMYIYMLYSLNKITAAEYVSVY